MQQTVRRQAAQLDRLAPLKMARRHQTWRRELEESRVEVLRQVWGTLRLPCVVVRAGVGASRLPVRGHGSKAGRCRRIGRRRDQRRRIFHVRHGRPGNRFGPAARAKAGPDWIPRVARRSLFRFVHAAVGPLPGERHAHERCEVCDRGNARSRVPHAIAEDPHGLAHRADGERHVHVPYGTLGRRAGAPEEHDIGVLLSETHVRRHLDAASRRVGVMLVREDDRHLLVGERESAAEGEGALHHGIDRVDPVHIGEKHQARLERRSVLELQHRFPCVSWR